MPFKTLLTATDIDGVERIREIGGAQLPGTLAGAERLPAAEDVLAFYAQRGWAPTGDRRTTIKPGGARCTVITLYKNEPTPLELILGEVDQLRQQRESLSVQSPAREKPQEPRRGGEVALRKNGIW